MSVPKPWGPKIIRPKPKPLPPLPTITPAPVPASAIDQHTRGPFKQRWRWRELADAGWVPPKKYIRPEGQPQQRKNNITPEWLQLCDYLTTLHGRPICGAIRKNGWPCERERKGNRTKCYRHGGSNRPAGILHPRYTTGRYTKALDQNKKLLHDYQQARSDPNLLALTEEISLLAAKQQETISRLSTGEHAISFRRAQYHFKRLEAAHRVHDDVGFKKEAETLDRILRGGLKDHRIWKEYDDRSDLIRKLVDTERKYKEGLKIYLPFERATFVMNTWLDCIRAVMPPEQIGLLFKEFRRRRLLEAPSMIPSGREIERVDVVPRDE